jgi:hypothetical protein
MNFFSDIKWDWQVEGWKSHAKILENSDRQIKSLKTNCQYNKLRNGTK